MIIIKINIIIIIIIINVVTIIVIIIIIFAAPKHVSFNQDILTTYAVKGKR